MTYLPAKVGSPPTRSTIVYQCVSQITFSWKVYLNPEIRIEREAWIDSNCLTKDQENHHFVARKRLFTWGPDVLLLRSFNESIKTKKRENRGARYCPENWANFPHSTTTTQLECMNCQSFLKQMYLVKTGSQICGEVPHLMKRVG